MNKQEVLEKIRSDVFVPVIRAGSSGLAHGMIRAVISGGLNCIEVTRTVPDSLQLIDDLSLEFGDEILIGAGTVLDVDSAKSCINAGAGFIVTPCLVPDVIQFCNLESVPVFAGAFSPTEVFEAWKLGADVVKLFPASVGGADYLKALKGPFPQIEIMPTGGVSLESAAHFWNAGAFALGVGGELTNPRVLTDAERFPKIRSNAGEFVELAVKLRNPA